MTKINVDPIERNSFFNQLLPNNPGLLILKFGAEWCKPCKLSKKQVYEYFNKMPENVLCYDVDVDDSFDLYAFFKAKRMINGIPVIMTFKKGNTSFVPDLTVTGANSDSITQFFNDSINLLNN